MSVWRHDKIYSETCPGVEIYKLYDIIVLNVMPAINTEEQFVTSSSDDVNL